ncbi:MAG: amidohydrolase [Patescibacteria group bacterium]|nr:amidohydrolase [Patescibacteria group bacterium]MDD5121214.1 amidohydrolase [Patescibacteria group bacterium]MDD5221757.1 amidohydrolase [Patescibacteria group bacterium]MDD5395867.1 amidohydrolase [Patescibacteria group bacterium]
MSKKIKFNLPLVNTHGHAAMLAFRGMAEDVPLDVWLNNYIWPAEKNITPQFIYKYTDLAIKEMKSNGIKLFCDMYFFAEEVARAAEKNKMPAVIGEGILDFPTPSAKTAEEALLKTEKLLQQYKNHSFIKVSVAPHSIYTVSKDNLLKAKELAKKYNALYQIHCAETKKEVDECLVKNNLTPVAYLDKLGVLDDKTLLAHCVWLTDEDIEIIAKRKAKVSHCPLSNLKLGSGIASVNKMLARGIAVSLGTDGAASSNRLDVWEAGKYTVLLQKGINYDPAILTARQAIEMMTINGLKSLGFDVFLNKTIESWQQKIKENKDYSFLYDRQVNELNFEI